MASSDTSHGWPPAAPGLTRQSPARQSRTYATSSYGTHQLNGAFRRRQWGRLQPAPYLGNLEAHAYRKTIGPGDLVGILVGGLAEIRIELPVRTHRRAIGGCRPLRPLFGRIGKWIEWLQTRPVEVGEDALLHNIAGAGRCLLDTLLIEQIDHVALEEQARAADRHAVIDGKARLVDIVQPEFAALAAEEIGDLRWRECVTGLGDPVGIGCAHSRVDDPVGVERYPGVVA